MDLPPDSPIWELLARWEEQRRRGRTVAAEELCQNHPELVEPLREAIHALESTSWLDKPITEEPNPTAEADDHLPDLGEYTLLEQIGAGGMGRVYKARHRRMDRIVALKILPEGAVTSAEALARFQQEVRTAAKLQHPNIVTAYDAGEVSGRPYLVMEYVEGSDLARHLRSHGPLPVGQVIDIIFQVASALEYAHKQGIVHGDIKPANLLLAPNGTVKILDLGLARFRATTAGEPPAGTVDYLPPEQMTFSTPVDPRSDIYSLGCTLFTLLINKPLFPGRTAVEKMMAHQQGHVPSLRRERPGVPGSLDGVFRRMVAREPVDRWQSMGQVAEALKRAERSLRRPGWPGIIFMAGVVTALACVISYFVAQGFRPAAVSEPFRGHTKAIWSVALSADGKTALSGGEDNTIRAWEVATGKQTAIAEVSEGSGIRSIALASDSSRFWSVHLNGPVVCRDASNLKEVYRLGGDTKGMRVLDCAPDGDLLILGGMDPESGWGKLGVWEAKSGTWLFSLPGHAKTVECVRFDGTGRLAVSGGWDGTVRIWDIPQHKERHCLRGHLGGVLAVAFSPDGTLCASGGVDGSVRLWDVATGEQVACLGAEVGSFNSLAFTPDGKRLVAGGGVPNGYDTRLLSDARRICRLFVWDVATGQLLGNLQGHESSIGSVAMAKDGLHVLSGSWDKTLRYWRIPDRDERVVAGEIKPAESVAAWSHLDVSDAEVMDGFVRISGVQQLPTRQSYSGPVEVTVVARTNENNIRLWGFRGGLVIFNWEGQKGHLHIHSPVDLARGFLGPPVYSQPCPLEPNRWYTLGWTVTEGEVEVQVDGKAVNAGEGKFDLSIARPIRVGAYLSVVDVKSFVVRSLNK